MYVCMYEGMYHYLFDVVIDWVCSISSVFLKTIAASSFSLANFCNNAAVELMEIKIYN